METAGGISHTYHVPHQNSVRHKPWPVGAC